MRPVAALGLAVLSLYGCDTVRRTAWQANIPGVSAPFRVDSVHERIGYLDARLSSGSLSRRIFARGDDPDCSELLKEGASVDWARSQPFGPLTDGAGTTSCRVAGLGDLDQWREVRGRATTSMKPITSSRTRYTIVYRDEEYLYAQGGFSIIGLLGWRPGTDQVIALLPHTEDCAGADRDGFATVEFRITGTPAFAVVTKEGLCPISGVVPAAVQGRDMPGDS
ncbi:MAG TPA: hypothetical protein VMW19_08720 [Myxococcota bacterium]|nr:hypothetical protein [Myxococcota bacterium]